LRKARRSQFDSRTASISFFAKGHPRTVPLPRAALLFFERLAKDKLPNAWLFTRDDGKPWAHSDWDEHVRAAAAKAELPAGVCSTLSGIVPATGLFRQPMGDVCIFRWIARSTVR